MFVLERRRDYSGATIAAAAPVSCSLAVAGTFMEYADHSPFQILVSKLNRGSTFWQQYLGGNVVTASVCL